MSRWGKASRGWVKAARRNVRYSRKHFCYRRLAVFGLGSFGAGVGQGGGRSAPCFVGATWWGCDLPYLLQDSFGGACPRKAVGMVPDGPALPAECGKDSAGDAARKGFRAERIHLEAHAHAKPWAWHPTDLPYLLVEDWHRHGCRMRKGFRRGCGPERIPGRAALTCPTCSVGSFGHREFLRCWLLALGRRGLVFSSQRAGRGAFSNQLSVVSQTRGRT